MEIWRENHENQWKTMEKPTGTWRKSVEITYVWKIYGTQGKFMGTLGLGGNLRETWLYGATSGSHDLFWRFWPVWEENEDVQPGILMHKRFPYPIGSLYGIYIYMLTFGVYSWQMLPYIAYMDPMGYEFKKAMDWDQISKHRDIDSNNMAWIHINPGADLHNHKGLNLRSSWETFNQCEHLLQRSEVAGQWFQINIWLVVWNMFYFHISDIGNNHPNWLSYFSEGWVNHQPDGTRISFCMDPSTWKLP